MKRTPLLTVRAAASSLPLLLTLLAGCQSPMGQPPASFGEAVRRNTALQVIDPAPEADPTPPGFDGARAALMLGRYKADKVDQPQSVPAAKVGVVLQDKN